MYLFSAGVANVTIYDGDQLLINGNTLSASSINFNVSSTPIRGGLSSAFYGRNCPYVW